MSASIYWSVALYFIQDIGSRLAWGVWVEILGTLSKERLASHASHEACELKSNKPKKTPPKYYVTPRMRRVSWNVSEVVKRSMVCVTPRMRRVSWNFDVIADNTVIEVTPRMRRVSWNCPNPVYTAVDFSHASHEACELKSWGQQHNNGT